MNFKKLLVAALILSQGVAVSTFAQNREEIDEMFPEPAQAQGTQILLGIADIMASGALWPNEKSQQVLDNSEQELEDAKSLLTSEEQRAQRIQAIKNNKNNFDEDELLEEHADRIERLEAADVVTKEEKQAAVALAETKVAEARQARVVAAQKAGKLSKAIKVVRIGASLFFVGDLVARVYVWNVYHRDPTILPAGVYLEHLVNQLNK